MRFLLLTVLLALPASGFAQSTCYSPSDCAGNQHCTSLDDGVIPGTCTSEVRGMQKSSVASSHTSYYSSSSSAFLSTTSHAASKKSAATHASSVTSVNSVSSAMSAASSVSSLPAEDQGKLNAMFASMMQSMTSLGNSITSMLSGMANSVKCIFGGCR